MQIQSLSTSPNTNPAYVRGKNDFDPTAQGNQSYKRDENAQKSDNTKLSSESTRAQASAKELQAALERTAETESVEKIESKKEASSELAHPTRITYGLRVLELMSDEEYQAFLWASEGMSEVEKMRMAQGLYRFTEFYQGKNQQESSPIDIQKLNAQKAFGVEETMMQNFINRYKNAYDRLLETQHLQSLSMA